MQFVAQSIILFLISFFISSLIGNILIKFLNRMHAKQFLSEYLRSSHESKKNTPTMGGLIFSIALFFVIFMLYFFHKLVISFNFIIILFTFFSYSLIGFLD